MSLISSATLKADAAKAIAEGKALLSVAKTDAKAAPRWLFSSKFFMTFGAAITLLTVGERFSIHIIYALAIIVAAFVFARAYETVGLAKAGQPAEGLDVLKLTKAVELELAGKGTPETKALVAKAFTI